MGYVELRGRSAFSFGDGTLTPEALVRAAAERGYQALALTDAADLGGVVRFAHEAAARGIRPLVGAELRVGGYPLALLARGEAGYHNLAALVTRARRGSVRGKPGLRWVELLERSDDLQLLTGPATGELAMLVRERRTAEAARLLVRWREAFGGRVAVEVQLHHVSGAESSLAAALIETAGRADVPWVVTNEPRYLDAEGRRVHDLQTALRAGLTVEEATHRGLLLPNSEWRLLSPAEMALRWQGCEAGVEETERIAAECTFELRWMRPPLPAFPVPPGETEDSYLRALVYAGAAERWGSTVGERERRQIEHELEVIGRLCFAGFFLVMWRAVRFARSRGILCQGRGSAANSVVAYCLEITAVDPVRHDLLFERFLSAARTDGHTEAPDIDVDFEMHRREEVLNYIYDRYGRDHAAITAVTQVYHAASALQDMMRALGYPAELALAVSKRIRHLEPAEGAELIERELGAKHGLETADARGRALLKAMRALEGVPRMRSTHPGGFVLSGRALGEYVPTEETTMGRTILQLDKDDLDVLGVPKFDFLGLGGLSATRMAFDSIEARTGKRLELYNLPQDDSETFRMISRGDTIGTFQIESRAQIQSLVQTRPEKLYDLVVQVALIRPGPIQGRFVHPYTRRRRGLEPVTYAHPALTPILARTQGIPIFQEQAMALSMALAGYTPAEADGLRRTMGHVRKQARLAEALEALRSAMEARGVEAAVAEGITADLQIFANYGFPESHAWSFALIAYATSYLKCHYPADFLLGLLNAWPMGFYAPSTLVHDAQRHGVEVRPPCMRDGAWESTLEARGEGEHPAVRIGWGHIRGLGERVRERLRQARDEGPFTSVEDLVRRAGLGRTEALHLSRAGALEAVEPGRRRAAWEALRAAGDVLPLAPARKSAVRLHEVDGAERVFLDYLATGICVDGHPMEHLRARLRAAGILSSADLPGLQGRERVLVAGLVIARQHPSTSKGTVFLLLEDESGLVNVIVGPKIYEANREVVKYSQFLLVDGRFERDGPVLNVVATGFRALEGSVAFQSRDFR
jgi:error-prone DNA polymerase